MRILFVDDDAGIRSVAKLSLERVGGHTVELCSSGHEAVKTAPVFAPDLIILDVTMPHMDGTDTLGELQKIPQCIAVPVIFLTANTQPHEIEQYKRLGALDVIAKPFDPMTLPGTISEMLRLYKTSEIKSVNEQLNVLQKEYAGQVPGKIQQIKAIWKEMIQSEWNKESLKKMHLIVHSLSGSGKTFGFDALSEAAHNLELFLKKISESDVLPAAGLKEQITKMLNALVNVVVNPEQKVPHKKEEGLIALPGRNIQKHLQRTIFLLEEDTKTAHDLALQIGYFGYNVCNFLRIKELQDTLAHSFPSAIIADIMSLKGTDPGIKTIKEIKQAYEIEMPIIFISANDDFESRLQAVSAGGNAYFTKPVDVSTLVDKLDTLTSPGISEIYRILVIDDEPELAAYHAMILKSAGMTTSIITVPEKIMEQVIEFRPDLVLMDVYMPGCNGMELAKVIRQKETFVSIPIVFLSSETDIDKQLQAMSLGGDDFLTKPIQAEHLVSAVTSRVERARILRSFMIHDSLTGLLTHTRIKEQMDIEIARAERQRSKLAFALIDIDYFKKVNDTYGHPTGDRVIKSLSRLLKQRLRKIDIVGRYGGEEFAVILVDTDGTAAVEILEKIRNDYARIHHRCGNEDFSSTFSCGIASYPVCRYSSELNDAADKALYEAKHRGRNRIVLAG